MIENSVVSWPPCWVARGGECAADLAVQGALGPQPAGLIEEIRHLRGHPAEPCAGADDDRVVIGKLLDLRDRSGLVELVVRGFGDLGRHQFGHALDIDGGAGFARALGNRVGHGFDVAIGGIIENENFGHGGLRGVSILEGIIAGLDPAIHHLREDFCEEGWMRESSPRMTCGVRGVVLRHAASTSTSSESSSAVIVQRASSRIATPSRALTRTPLTSTAPAAGTR